MRKPIQYSLPRDFIPPPPKKKKIMPPPPQPEFHAPPTEKKICPAPQFWISCPPHPNFGFHAPLFIHLFCGLFGVWGRVSDEQYYWNVPPEVNSTRKCEMYGFFGGFFFNPFFRGFGVLKFKFYQNYVRAFFTCRSLKSFQKTTQLNIVYPPLLHHTFSTL